MIHALNMQPVNVDGCAFHLGIDGKRPLRPWTIQTTSDRMRGGMASKTCSHAKDHKHDVLEGSITAKSGIYNVEMAVAILTLLFPGVIVDRVPAMPLQPFEQHAHREKEVFVLIPSLPILGTIYKLLTRKQMLSAPDALKAVRDEGEGVRKRGAWDDDDVMEKNDRLEAAKAAGEVIYIAEIMSIASIKHWETPAKRRRKGRIVLRGDDVRDAWGSAAVFGQLYSLPTNVQATNIALFYGMLHGNSIWAADCVKAYLQASLLNQDAEKMYYVCLPEELWLPHWRGVCKKPCVPLLTLRPSAGCCILGHAPEAGSFGRHET